eukprot:CAMPEP_0195113142 /NCGR_PEP_ID=MMETSP0448-20130528/101408_1 /TAXON_ID=66468 /ORGANISM="Heterocapsa triquestra, Strain CCMP 448" /LENGTH=40 /DNA_ID= /DNA_START= /DNA_END= /DNA_ORIENTATION=
MLLAWDLDLEILLAIVGRGREGEASLRSSESSRSSKDDPL